MGLQQKMTCLKNLDQATRSSQTSEERNLVQNTYLTVAQKRRIRRKNAIIRKTARKIDSVSESQANTTKDTVKSNQKSNTYSLPQQNNKEIFINDSSLKSQVVTDINETTDMKSRNYSESKSSDSKHNNKTIIVQKSQYNKSAENSNQLSNMASKNEGKTREEIVAEREAKKQSKQKNKEKIGTKDAKVVISALSSAVKVPEIKSTIQSVNSLKNQDTTSNAASSKPKNVAKIEDSLAQKSSVKNNNLRANMEDNKSKDSAKVEKTREEIKSEREAKKLAKQVAKGKVKSNDSAACKADKPPTGSTREENKKSLLRNEKLSDPNKLAENFEALQIQTTAEKEAEDAKSKASLRAERRAKQEAQRAAKENAKISAENITNKKTVKASKELISREKKPIRIEENKATKTLEKAKVRTVKSLHKVKLFQHLYAEREVISRVALNSKDVHPAIVRLGVQYSSRVIAGSNARCISLLNALKVLVTDYVLPAKTEFARGLETYLASNMAFLKSQRPLAVSMINALKHLRWQLTQLPNTITEFDAKIQLNEAIDTYIREQIEVAGQAISIAVQNKISKGDVILTYGCSSLIEKILCEAWASIPSFSIVVVGSRPGRDGHELLRRLASTGLPCTYVDITALSYVMRKTNKVLLGAGALLANGSVMARAGTAQVALVAHAHNVPVLVCCETHKFSERVQTDSFVYNEIGDPDELVQIPSATSPLCDWRSIGAVTPLNLTYDVTPPDLVTAVVTELAILPCTSVPVVLRFKLSEYGI